MNRPGASILILLAMMALQGCATPAPYEQMVPQGLPAAASLKGVALTIAPVTGGMETKSWDVSRIGNAEFQQALDETLRQAGAAVSASAGNGYALTTEIVSQNVTGSFSNTITLLVHYSLKNPLGKRIWSENILSQQELSVKDSFSGSGRMKRLQTEAVQSNLTQLVQKLAKAIGEDTRRNAPQ
ncbi:MAG: hypothetical protein KGL63_12740 [Betaproteobacteria bacterium]|nr:hypothetical protein [Betaproteobacteria bacterium]